MTDEPKRPAVKRRDFLKIVGVSSAAATTVGCSSEDVGKLIPYLVSPDQTVPGVSNYYATTCRECSAACGVIAETRDGHVVKLEGNPAHPVNRGALCARGQAALQGLYNPDRFRGPMAKRGTQWSRIGWDEGLNVLTQRLTQARGGGQAGNALFLNQHESGSFPSFLDAWLAAFGMRPHLSVDFEADHAAMEANRRAYGAAWPRLDFSAARLIVSFGADFLDGWGASVPQQLDFADARAKLVDAPRFVYVGPRRSLTGLNADRWIACRPGSELAILNFLRGQGSAQEAATASGAPAQALDELAGELRAARPSMILAGTRGANALDVALAASALNQSLGNVGTTIRPAEGYAGFDGVARFDTLLTLTEQMQSGDVPLVFVRGANPAYHMPAQARFAEAFARVPFKVSFSSYPDETSELCDLILPDLHSLEQWGDAELVRGTLSLQQPAMDPVFAETRATADVLIQIAKRDPALAARFPYNDYRGWLTARFPGGAPALATALARGVAPGSAAARPAQPAPAAAPRLAPTLTPQGEFSFVTYPSPVLGDGRGANKPWLQELPDPVTKVCWSSWVEIHPETAARLGIERGDVLEVRTAAGAVRAPAYVYMGIRPDTVAMALGRGHRSPSKQNWFEWGDDDVQWGYGRYARNIGANALDAIAPTSDGAGGLVLATGGATIRKTGEHATVPSTEGSARQHGRGVAQAVVVTELRTLRQAPGAERAAELAPGGTGAATQGPAAEGQHGGGHDIPGSADHKFLPGLRSPVAADAQGELGAPTSPDRGVLKGLYDPNHPSGMAKRRWAMTVDLARCTGCSACVTACYAENNIPTVGAPWQNASVFAVERPGFNITRGREMNWIRIERYFEGNEEGRPGLDFETRFVPMLCQHCGNAPCEPVCPVYATYHAPDGLNVQVYNRCVGTRYCSNNCPYKVRYFNWFGYGEPDRKQYAFPEPLNWQLNPDVTVRGKGVMEKCTFCVQRIREAEHRAALEHRELGADEFTTACAAACPSRAIVFGDAAAPDWSVTRLVGDARAYHVFEELNTYTAVVYLKKVNHPQPAAR
jgi:anaerobic selenocysteine-containing dehydrogenase/Fe-S-cluster-containing dehydrogenase component